MRSSPLRGRVASFPWAQTPDLDLLLSEPDPHEESAEQVGFLGSPFWRDEEAPPPPSVMITRPARGG